MKKDELFNINMEITEKEIKAEASVRSFWRYLEKKLKENEESGFKENYYVGHGKGLQLLHGSRSYVDTTYVFYINGKEYNVIEGDGDFIGGDDYSSIMEFYNEFKKIVQNSDKYYFEIKGVKIPKKDFESKAIIEIESEGQKWFVCGFRWKIDIVQNIGDFEYASWYKDQIIDTQEKELILRKEDEFIKVSFDEVFRGSLNKIIAYTKDDCLFVVLDGYKIDKISLYKGEKILEVNKYLNPIITNKRILTTGEYSTRELKIYEYSEEIKDFYYIYYERLIINNKDVFINDHFENVTITEEKCEKEKLRLLHIEKNKNFLTNEEDEIVINGVKKIIAILSNKGEKEDKYPVISLQNRHRDCLYIPKNEQKEIALTNSGKYCLFTILYYRTSKKGNKIGVCNIELIK